MKKYVIGNWKCYKTTDDGLAWFRQFSKLYRASEKVDVVVAPTIMKNLADKTDLARRCLALGEQ